MPIETLRLDYPSCLASAFPDQLPDAIAAVDDVLRASGGGHFDRLIERSPGLKDSDFTNYLRCSIARMCYATAALTRCGVSAGRVLDYGSYFGNFSLMLHRRGYHVEAVDAYTTYAADLSAATALLNSAGVHVRDFADTGRDLAGLPAAQFDAILCMGVVEHIPHTPRLFLQALDRVLAPGGVLLLETPNVAHLYNRQKLARGEPIMTPLESQFYASLPFEGHHREYTPGEVVWMAEQLGHSVEQTYLYNYSIYEQRELTGRDVTNFQRMAADPALREVALVVSRKPRAGAQPARANDWRQTLVDLEPASPPAHAAGGVEQLEVTEPLLVEMRAELAARDALLQQLQQAVNAQTAEIAVRDRMLQELADKLNKGPVWAAIAWLRRWF